MRSDDVKELRKILNDLDEKFDDSEINVQGDGYDIESFEIYSGFFPTLYLTLRHGDGHVKIEEDCDESNFPYHTFLD